MEVALSHGTHPLCATLFQILQRQSGVLAFQLLIKSNCKLTQVPSSIENSVLWQNSNRTAPRSPDLYGHWALIWKVTSQLQACRVTKNSCTYRWSKDRTILVLWNSVESSIHTCTGGKRGNREKDVESLCLPTRRVRFTLWQAGLSDTVPPVTSTSRMHRASICWVAWIVCLLHMQQLLDSWLQFI